MSKLRFAGLVAGLACLVLAGSACAHDYKTGSLTIVHPWTRATPGGAEVAGGYMTLVNTGSVADRLVGGSLDAASAFELHTMAMNDGVMTMRPIGPLEIPAGGSVTLNPSGAHIMFTGLKRAVKQGEMIEGTLVFDHAGRIAVRFAVEAVGAREPAGKEGHKGQSMPGMTMD